MIDIIVCTQYDEQRNSRVTPTLWAYDVQGIVENCLLWIPGNTNKWMDEWMNEYVIPLNLNWLFSLFFKLNEEIK